MIRPPMQVELKYMLSLNYRLRADLSLNVSKREDIWIEISTYHGSIIFAVIYRHPKTDFKHFEDSLCNILIELENKKQNNVVTGILNWHLLILKLKITLIC